MSLVECLIFIEKCHRVYSSIHSFILNIYIASLQENYCEVLIGCLWLLVPAIMITSTVTAIICSYLMGLVVTIIVAMIPVVCMMFLIIIIFVFQISGCQTAPCFTMCALSPP